jgi:hypothetical protein
METEIKTQGFKVDYSRVQRAIKQLDEEKKAREFKQSLKDLGIETY